MLKLGQFCRILVSRFLWLSAYTLAVTQLSLLSSLPVGTKLQPDYEVLGLRESRDGRGLFYKIPNRNGGRPYSKKVIEMEFEKERTYFEMSREFTLDWYRANMPITAKQSDSCSFRLVGEIFAFHGLAKRVAHGRGHKYVAL